jgi:hypothetical protein
MEWKEGNSEDLLFEDGAFDVVLSSFGHMFAARSELANGKLLSIRKIHVLFFYYLSSIKTSSISIAMGNS